MAADFWMREGREHTSSYYAATAKGVKDRPSLQGEVKADVCVIGAGFTGVSAALNLAERGFDVVVVEAARVGWGASGRNGGQLNTGQRQDQLYLEELFGLEQAKRLWAFAEEAKATVKERIAKHAIDCDLKPGNLHVASKASETEGFFHDADHMHKVYDYDVLRAVDRAELSQMLGTQRYHAGLLDMTAAHLHPLNYCLGLAAAAETQGVRIFENTQALKVNEGREIEVTTPQGKVRASHLVYACNGYLGGLEARINGRIMPINNFIIATEPLSEAEARDLIRDDVCVSDSKFVVDYFRLSADRRMLWGGGENYRRSFPADIASFVKPYMLKTYPQLAGKRIDYAWGGTLAITINRLPGLGRLGKNIFYAQGFSGQGVALTSLAGKLIAEALAGTAERFDVMSQIPQPVFPGGTLLRWPGMIAAVFYYSLRDKLP